MARRIFSLYEAKARFSEILKAVREGRTITVSYHGEPVAEIRPIGAHPTTLEDRLAVLHDRGVLVRTKARSGRLAPIARKAGALKRFLAERE